MFLNLIKESRENGRAGLRHDGSSQISPWARSGVGGLFPDSGEPVLSGSRELRGFRKKKRLFYSPGWGPGPDQEGM